MVEGRACSTDEVRQAHVQQEDEETARGKPHLSAHAAWSLGLEPSIDGRAVVA